MSNNAPRYILAVAQAGSIRIAAQTLNVAQSAISRQILNVETDLGTPLFERHARGVSPTYAGEIYLRYARDDRALTERMRAELDALKGLRRGVVRVWAIESVAQEILPRAIGHFTRSNPGIRFEVSVTSTDEVIAAVQDMKADLGIAFQPQVPPDVKVSFRIRHPLHALMSVNHPLAGAESISILETLAYPIALTPSGSGSRILIDATVSAAGAVMVPTVESNSVRVLTHFACESAGITFLSRFCSALGVRPGRITAVRLRDRLMNVSRLEVLTQAGRVLPDVAEQFRTVLISALQAGPENASGPLASLPDARDG